MGEVHVAGCINGPPGTRAMSVVGRKAGQHFATGAVDPAAAAPAKATVTDIPVANGTLKVIYRPGQDAVAFGDLSTPIGSLKIIVKLGAKPAEQAPQGQATGMTAGPMPIACYDVEAFALNDAAQTAVSSGLSYVNSTVQDRARVKHECMRILKAALGDENDRAYYRTLALLAAAPAAQFAQMAAQAHRSAVPDIALLGHLTQAEVRDEADILVHAYRYMATALPWLTGEMKDIEAKLEAGDFNTVRGDLYARYMQKFSEPQKDAPVRLKQGYEHLLAAQTTGQAPTFPLPSYMQWVRVDTYVAPAISGDLCNNNGWYSDSPLPGVNGGTVSPPDAVKQAAIAALNQASQNNTLASMPGQSQGGCFGVAYTQADIAGSTWAFETSLCTNVLTFVGCLNWKVDVYQAQSSIHAQPSPIPFGHGTPHAPPQQPPPRRVGTPSLFNPSPSPNAPKADPCAQQQALLRAGRTVEAARLEGACQAYKATTSTRGQCEATYQAGCPMRIGQYREMTGCQCDNPCEECRCVNGPCPCE